MKTHISVDTKIKVGLIGFGRMGRFYLKEMQKSGRWEVAYICDIESRLPGTGEEIISRIEDTGKRTGNVR